MKPFQDFSAVARKLLGHLTAALGTFKAGTTNRDAPLRWVNSSASPNSAEIAKSRTASGAWEIVRWWSMVEPRVFQVSKFHAVWHIVRERRTL